MVTAERADERVKAAIVYDFDGTLSPGSMQEHSFIPELGYANVADFWDEVRAVAEANDADEILTYMQLMLRQASQPFGRSDLRRHGAGLPLFPGVPGWFDRVNSEAAALGLALEHFVVSSGIREMIEACEVACHFKRIFASGFVYGEDDEAIWPAVAINYTGKTQFLFRINKGIGSTWDNGAINRWVPLHERPVPFERMIFIGDGDTDIPSMKMTRQQGGVAIAVFDQDLWHTDLTQAKITNLIAEDRATYAAPADYSPRSLLDVTVRGVLGRMAREAGYRPQL